MVAHHDGSEALYVLTISNIRAPGTRVQHRVVANKPDFLIPLSPTLPLLTPLFISFLRSITTAEYLHQPYFETKGMSKDEVWRWVEERKWAYRGMST